MVTARGMKLGHALRAARLAKGMTQEQAAYWAHTSRSQISNYETQDHEPSLRSLRMLADVYGCTVASLINEEPMTMDCLTRTERAVIELIRSEP